MIFGHGIVITSVFVWDIITHRGPNFIGGLVKPSWKLNHICVIITWLSGFCREGHYFFHIINEATNARHQVISCETQTSSCYASRYHSMAIDVKIYNVALIEVARFIVLELLLPHLKKPKCYRSQVADHERHVLAYGYFEATIPAVMWPVT